MHRNEVDFTDMPSDEFGKLAALAVILGPKYFDALAEQMKRQGISEMKFETKNSK